MDKIFNETILQTETLFAETGDISAKKCFFEPSYDIYRRRGQTAHAQRLHACGTEWRLPLPLLSSQHPKHAQLAA